MDMTKKRLEEHRSKREEIRELQYKLDHLGEGDSLIGNSVIMDYRTGFPRPQSVVGYDFGEEKRKKETWEKRMEKLKRECEEDEAWIEAIQDSLTRRIFEMCYIDGLKQKAVARKVHLDKSRISRKIDNFLKNASKATNATV